jgi:hypothetical protein
MGHRPRGDGGKRGGTDAGINAKAASRACDHDVTPKASLRTIGLRRVQEGPRAPGHLPNDTKAGGEQLTPAWVRDTHG